VQAPALQASQGMRVGTSGWQNVTFLGRFYPATVRSAEQLRYYSERLNAAEVNSTFYRFSRPSTFASWREKSAEGFRMTVKAPRTFTHENGLRDPEGRLREFLEASAHLGEKLGPTLFQLPHSFEADLRRLSSFLKTLPSGRRFAFELRHPSWHRPATYRLLERHGAAFCVFDIRQSPSPVVATSDFVYVRLHGPLRQPYRGAYSRDALEQWLDRAHAWEREGREAYLFFDNTMSGEAIEHALFMHRADLALAA
jgi:uncharacterized protein YecE (DUF72 family)